MNILLVYIKILRPINMLLASLSVIITAYLTETLSKPTIIINAIIVVSLFVGASNILNDIFDVRIDKKNKPQRPLAAKKISSFQSLLRAPLHRSSLRFAGMCASTVSINAPSLNPGNLSASLFYTATESCS